MVHIEILTLCDLCVYVLIILTPLYFFTENL